MRVLIQPLDLLFVRDGKPFSMGEDVTAQSVFPPPPSTFYGALRSAYFGTNPNEFTPRQLNTDDDPTVSLTVRGVHVYDVEKKHFIFPIPLDLVIKEDDSERQAYELQMKERNFSSNYPFRTILAPPDEQNMYRSAEGKYINGKELKKYLQGLRNNEHIRYLPPEEGADEQPIAKTEMKIGIAIDRRTRTAEESKLYRMGMKRLHPAYRFFVDFDGLDGLKDSGLLRLGGEGRTAFYSKTEIEPPTFAWPDYHPNSSSSPSRQLFKLYFAAPTYFANGWLPSWIDPETMSGEYQGIKLDLVTAAVGKYMALGGFDMKERYPKPMRRFVGAGSVYYFAVSSEHIEEVTTIFHGQCICDEPQWTKPTYAQQGFGLCYVGKVAANETDETSVV
ncbi:type III-B CRISPR module-associated protein Cmr3 [Geobacillus sp. YF-1]|uniref:type III-B CRISPR module-associated protein Cmr3 n=1 Tax=Geobacillus sp. YF-1 TaxID=3457480 RepID=UPI0040460303